MGDARSLKVLIAGDINGKFDSLFQRVEKVNSSNGPFDVLLCTGSFLDPAGSAASRFSPCLAPFTTAFSIIS